MLRSLAQARCYTHISVDQIKLFIAGIESLQHGALAHPSLIITPPPPPPPPAAAKAQRRLERKQERASKLEQLLPTLSNEGYTLVFTDGSSELVPGIGRVAGYGIFSSDLLSISAYVPVHLRQTNNTAELFAVLRAIQLLPPGRHAFCSDSSYVILGASGAARRWKLRGWTGSSGPVSNVEIWEQLLSELSQPDKTIKWVKVPSHVTVEGNNEADRLADLGRLSSPLHPILHTPSTFSDFSPPRFTPLKKARFAATSTHDLSEVSRKIVFQSPAAVRFSSVTASDILRSLDLEPLSDSDESGTISDYSDSDTVTADDDSDNDSAYSTDVSDTRKRRLSQ